MKVKQFISPLLCGVALSFGLAATTYADGMVPETSVVIVNEADGEATIRVRNDDKHTSLLLVTLVDLPEDPEPLLFLTQPVWRVAAGQSQTVRFILRTGVPLTTQRLKRVIFEGVPAQSTSPSQAKVGVSVRQNLPVIIHPEGLPVNRTPWTGLQWHLHGQRLTVENPTAYVVRLSQEVRLMPSQQGASLPRSYVLPGETLEVALAEQAAGDESVKLFPATVYGYAVDSFLAPLNKASR